MKSAFPTAMVGALAIFLLAQDWDYGRRSVACEAVVLSSNTFTRSGTTLADVSYFADGRLITASLRAWFCHLDRGQRVPILYIPSDPANVTLDRFWQRHFRSMIALAVFAALVCGETLRYIAARRRRSVGLRRDDCAGANAGSREAPSPCEPRHALPPHAVHGKAVDGRGGGRRAIARRRGVVPSRDQPGPVGVLPSRRNARSTIRAREARTLIPRPARARVSPAMNFPRVRFTVRRMMVAVAIVALATWQAMVWSRQPRYRRLADVYAAKETLARGNPSLMVRADSIIIKTRDATKVIYRTMPGDGPFTCNSANRDYYAEMARKYKWAAQFSLPPCRLRSARARVRPRHALPPSAVHGAADDGRGGGSRHPDMARGRGHPHCPRSSAGHAAPPLGVEEARPNSNWANITTKCYAPFWPRYWRAILGRPWPGTYHCECLDAGTSRSAADEYRLVFTTAGDESAYKAAIATWIERIVKPQKRAGVS